MKKQTIYNNNWSVKQNNLGFCRFCKNKKMINQKTCTICYLKVMAKNNLNDRSLHEKLYEKLVEQDFKCYMTGRELVLGLNASVDHVIPRSKNEELSKKIENIKWCDKRVNFVKRELTLDEFINLCRDVVSHNK